MITVKYKISNLLAGMNMPDAINCIVVEVNKITIDLCKQGIFDYSIDSSEIWNAPNGYHLIINFKNDTDAIAVKLQFSENIL